LSHKRAVPARGKARQRINQSYRIAAVGMSGSCRQPVWDPAAAIKGCAPVFLFDAVFGLVVKRFCREWPVMLCRTALSFARPVWGGL